MRTNYCYILIFILFRVEPVGAGHKSPKAERKQREPFGTVLVKIEPALVIPVTPISHNELVSLKLVTGCNLLLVAVILLLVAEYLRA